MVVEGAIAFAIIVLLALAVVVVVLPVIAIVRAGAAFRRVDELETELRVMKSRLHRMETRVDDSFGAPGAARVAAQTQAPPAEQPAAPVTPAPPVVPPAPTVPPAPPVPPVPPVTVTPPSQPAQPAQPTPPPPVTPPPVGAQPVYTRPEGGERAERLYQQTQQAAHTHVMEPARQGRTRDEWEVIFGSNLLNRIGAIALLLGIAYFLKYAFDHNWITPWLRIVMGVGVGVGVLAVGNYFYKKGAEIFAQGLLGAGTAILYLSVYASFKLYGLVPGSIAFLAMAVVTASAVLQALKYDSLAVSIIGLIGGFLTPLLMKSTGGGGPDPTATLFTYIAILDAGLLAVALAKDRWVVLEPLTLTGTALTYMFWHADYFTPARLPVVIAYLTIFWALFYAVDLYRNLSTGTTFPEVRMLVAIANSALYFTAIFIDVNPVHHSWIGPITFLLSAAYLGAAVAAIRGRSADSSATPRYILTAVSFLVIATALQFVGFARVAWWAVEAFIVLWAGLHWKIRAAWIPALVMFVVAIIDLTVQREAFGYRTVDAFVSIFNLRFLAYAALGAALAAGSVLFARSDEAGEDVIAPTMHYIWTLLMAIAFTVEANDLFRRLVPTGAPGFQAKQLVVMASVWVLYSLPLVWTGLVKRVEPLVNIGLVSFVVGAAFMLGNASSYEPVRDFILLLNWRAGVLLLAIATALIHAYWFRSRQDEYPYADTLRSLLWLIVGIIGAELVTVETLDGFRKLSASAIPTVLGSSLGLAQAMVLALVWAAYSILVTAHAAWKKLTWNFAVAFAAAVGALLAVAGGTEFSPVQNFTLLFNLRAISMLLVMAAMLGQGWILKRLAGEYAWTENVRRAIEIVVCILGFELVTVETLDWFRAASLTKPLLFGMDPQIGKMLTLAAVWMLYSLVLTLIGSAREKAVTTALGLASAAAGVVLAAFCGIMFVPASAFVPVANYRTAVLLLAAAVTAFQSRIARNNGVCDWTDTAGYACSTAAAILIGEILTVEITDYARHSIAHSWTMLGLDPEFVRDLLLAAVWAVYSIPLMWLGLRRKNEPLLVLSFIAIGLALITGAIPGSRYVPIDKFVAVANPRFFALAVVAAAMIIHQWMLSSLRSDYDWVRPVAGLYRVLASLFVFELLTLETWNYYERAATERDIRLMANMRQLALSVVWVLYSIILMSIGIWKRTLSVRVVAIALFYLTIAKLFIIDLSFLDTLYRALSFTAVAPILFATSYLYQRYKTFIFAVEEPVPEKVGQARRA